MTTLREIMIETCYRCDVTPGELRGYSRKSTFCWPRHAFMAKAREAGFSLTQIGQYLRRDHTTVINGISRHHERLAAGRVDQSGRAVAAQEGSA